MQGSQKQPWQSILTLFFLGFCSGIQKQSFSPSFTASVLPLPYLSFIQSLIRGQKPPSSKAEAALEEGVFCPLSTAPVHPSLFFSLGSCWGSQKWSWWRELFFPFSSPRSTLLLPSCFCQLKAGWSLVFPGSFSPRFSCSRTEPCVLEVFRLNSKAVCLHDHFQLLVTKGSCVGNSLSLQAQ